MKSLNLCEFIGRLGADPETKQVRSGPGDGLVVNIRIAVDDTYKDRDGREAGTTEWVPIVLFGKPAEIADKWLRKGSQVFVLGKFKTRQWEDRDGNKRYTSEIVVDNFDGKIQLLDSDRDSDRGSGRDRDDRDRGSRDDRGRDRDRDGRRGDDRRDRDRRDDRRDDNRRDDRDRRDDRRDDHRDSGGGRSEGRNDSYGTRAAGSRDMDDDIPFD